MRKLFGFVAALALAVPASAQDKTVCDVLTNNDQFSTLTKAIQAAGLEETLKGDGPYTILAPTNDAFRKLPQGQLEELLKPENKEQLAGLLKHHVLTKKVMANQTGQLDGQSVATACTDGIKCKVSSQNGKVAFSCGENSANVVKADIMASNGVIHAIDAVLMAPAK